MLLLFQVNIGVDHGIQLMCGITVRCMAQRVHHNHVQRCLRRGLHFLEIGLEQQVYLH